MDGSICSTYDRSIHRGNGMCIMNCIMSFAALRANAALYSSEGLSDMTGASNHATALQRTARNIAAALILLGPMLTAYSQQPFQTLLVGVDRRPVTSLN